MSVLYMASLHQVCMVLIMIFLESLIELKSPEGYFFSSSTVSSLVKK